MTKLPILYLAKEPDKSVMKELTVLKEKGKLTVVACIEGYLEFYQKMGYNTISLETFFSL